MSTFVTEYVPETLQIPFRAGTGSLEQAMDTAHEHLGAYGHEMSWRESTMLPGSFTASCGRCKGSVSVFLDDRGTVRITASTALLGSGTGDYAECASRRGRRAWKD